MGRAARSALRLVLASVIAIAILLLSIWQPTTAIRTGRVGGTTAAGATTFTYDAAADSHVDAPAIGVASDASARLERSLPWSAQRSSSRHGPSKTPAAGSVATKAARPAVGFAPGAGVSALTAGRLLHGTAHLTQKGVLPVWSGRTSPQLIRDTLGPILENPSATFSNTLGGTQVKGFIGTVNGQTVAVQVYAEGPLAGQLATLVVPTANQVTKWGVGP